uniref:Carcinoembryonic antigen-related cell adhesion molecule 6-like n=1 Tax=Erpetoichthys calabaricus TaxID=27687 RepID=A0A8C4TI54_ERPCA
MEMEVRAGVVLAALSLSLFSYCCSAASLITPQNILNGTVGGEITFDISVDPVDLTASAGTWKFGSNVVVTWTNSNPVYTNDYKGRVEVTFATGTLKFNKLFATDSGEYTVTITTAPSTLNLNGRVELKVYDPVSVPTIQSNVTNPVEFNDTVTLTCTASGSDVSYRWFNGSSELSDTQRVHLSADNRNLTISGVLRSDDGPFYCYVYNHVSKNFSKPFNLDVKYGPDLPTLSVSLNKSVYTAGSSLTLQCSAQSNPTAQYQWFLNGTSLNKRSQQLEIKNIQVDQAGNYTCWAFNNVTLRYAAVHTVIDVIERVSEVTIQPQSEKPTENENFSLTCFAKHANSFLWLKDGHSLDTNGTVSLLDNNQMVFFNPLLQSYTGTYKCTAFNIVSNETSKEYTLVMNSDGNSLTTAGIVAIAVCSVLLVLAVTALVVFLLIRHRRSSTGSSKSSSPTTKPEDGLVYSTPTFLKEPGDRKSKQNADPNAQYANISKQPQVQSNTATEYAELRRK